jgi:hypothetical protein
VFRRICSLICRADPHQRAFAYVCTCLDHGFHRHLYHENFSCRKSLIFIKNARKWLAIYNAIVLQKMLKIYDILFIYRSYFYFRSIQNEIWFSNRNRWISTIQGGSVLGIISSPECISVSSRSFSIKSKRKYFSWCSLIWVRMKSIHLLMLHHADEICLHSIKRKHCQSRKTTFINNARKKWYYEFFIQIYVDNWRTIYI